MGALFQVRFAYYPGFDAYADDFPRPLYPFMTGSSRRLEETVFDRPCALVFGSESSGLPDDFQKLGTAVRIQHAESIDSLNLSVAVGIGLYQFSLRPRPG